MTTRVFRVFAAWMITTLVLLADSGCSSGGNSGTGSNSQAQGTYSQQVISSFAPSAGVVGSTITVTGSGFTGSTTAWVGNGHDAVLTVVSDSQATVTVPADATTGAVTLVNPQYSASSSASFTVQPTYPQPAITSFSPTTGTVGTVLSVTGSGFTGATTASVGNGHDAALTVISDTWATVTVPPDGSTGAVTIGNPSYSASSSTPFTLQPVYVQQAITSFSPTSGKVGTVVTVVGTGFTGSTSAWVGNGHDAALTVISDTQASVTVPADATTGAITLINPAYSASSSTSFTVQASYAQQVINNFTPAKGSPGTAITVFGSGFTGSTSAWVGGGHDASLTVVSDTRATITVPADATTGPIAILNPDHSATSSTNFTIQTSYPQQTISSFTPASGVIGTAITVTGTGFTGSTAAWVGSGHDALLSVVSDTQATVTVPADATTGVITLVNPSHTASSSASFTVTSGTPTLAIHVSGKNLVNAAGMIVQLRGANYSGYEFAAIQGWGASDPSGTQAGQPGGPNLPAMLTWKANALRIPLNEASWLGYTCTDTSGVVHNPDPGNNYKSAVTTQVAQANAAGLYVILDLHWTAPGSYCPMLQTQMADADHSLAFWTSVANTFKNNPAVMFELFNEPFFNYEFSGNSWSYMMNGTGGAFTGFPATSSSNNWTDIKMAWTVASYQDMINAVRDTGATNVVVVGTMQYSQDFSGWLANRPSDPLNQMAAAWHPYRQFNSAWDYPYPNYYPQVFTDAQNILAAGIPIIMTEIGGQNTDGTKGCPICDTMTGFADTYGTGVTGWTWDIWGDPENVLIKDVNGTPTDGYGVTYRNWMVNHK